MTVVSSIVTRPKPGRRNDGIAMAAEAAKILERHGAKNCRLFVAQTAGEASGSFTFLSEFDSNETYGAFADEMAGDAELQALVDRLDAPDSPVLVTESQSLSSEIPLERSGKPGRGTVLEVYVSRPLPGRFEAAVALGTAAFDFVESHGAVNARLFQVGVAGSLSDALAASWEFDSMRSRGKAADAFQSDPAGQAVIEILNGPDCPITPISSAIYREVPV